VPLSYRASVMNPFTKSQEDSVAKIELTEDMKREMQGLLPISYTAVVEFTPEEIKKVDEILWPVFKLRRMTKAESLEIRRLASASGDAISNEEKVLNVVRKCVVGWDNLIDMSTGDEIPYVQENGELSKSLWDMMSITCITAIMNKVSLISGLLNSEKLGLK